MARPARPSRGQVAAGRTERPSRAQLQNFLDTPARRPSTGRRDLAKIGTGAAVGALGFEGARRLLESRPGGPGERPLRPERPARPEQPMAGRPERPEKPIARPPHRPGKPLRPEHPIARPPYRPVKPIRPVYPVHWPGHRIPPRWWRHAAWGVAAGWIVGASFGAPVYYDYDENIYYEGDYVYVDGRKVATSQEYYDQAATLADSAHATQDTASKDWLPLGVFALSQGDTDESNMMIQLAVDKEGVIEGTYYNTSTDVKRPIKGMVDKKSQRAAWTFADGKNTDIIMETGLYNLTKDETQVLVHFGPDITQKWRLVRLEQPKSGEKGT